MTPQNAPILNLVRFLKAEVDKMTLRQTQVRVNRSHRISSVGGRRSRRGQRGVRGNNRQHDGNSNQSRQIVTRFVDGRRIHNGIYIPKERRRLTQPQYKAVRDMRRQAHRSNQNNRNKRNNQLRPNSDMNISGLSQVRGNEEENGEGGGDHVDHAQGDGTVCIAQARSVENYLGQRRSNHNPRETGSST